MVKGCTLRLFRESANFLELFAESDFELSEEGLVDWDFFFFWELACEGYNSDVLLEGIVVAIGSSSSSLPRRVYP